MSEDGVQITAAQARELRRSFEDVLLKASVAILAIKNETYYKPLLCLGFSPG